MTEIIPAFSIKSDDLIDAYVRVWHSAVTVKNAVLIEITRDDQSVYILSHYATNILTVRNKEIIDIKPVSMSSCRAIRQALSFLDIDKTVKQIKAEFKEAGKYVPSFGAY